MAALLYCDHVMQDCEWGTDLAGLSVLNAVADAAARHRRGFRSEGA